MIATGEALLAEIVADPEDLAARLAYADWLEERGECDRAEFVRVQVELAETAEPVGVRQSEQRTEWDRRAAHYDDLRRRERELRPHQQTPAVLWATQSRFGGSGTLTWEYRRGFVEVVRCRLEDWVGRPCNACMEPLEDVPHSMCRLCHGTGRIDAHGPAIVRACPVRLVEFTDERAVRGSMLTTTRHILWEFFRVLPITQNVHDSYSNAAIAWARKEAGLC